MIVECARCGWDYVNPRVTSQLDADGRLEVCDLCRSEIAQEIEDAERGQ